MKLPVSRFKPLVLALVTAGMLGSVLHGGPAPVAHADGDTTAPCVANSWPAIPNLDLGRVLPGAYGGGNTAFLVHAGGQVSVAVTDGTSNFQATGIASFTISRRRIAIDPADMPRGYHGNRFYYETVCTLDTQTDGSGSMAVSPGEMVVVYVKGTQDPSQSSSTGTLAVSFDSTTKQVPISMFVGGIRASLDAPALSIPQGRSGDIPVTVTSLGGADTNATFDLYDSVPGITVSNPAVYVPSGQTVHTSLHVVVDRNAPLGDQNYNLAVTAFEDQTANDRQTLGLGSFTLTVAPLPVQSVTIPLGAAADAWNAARSSACDRIKDLTGQEALAYLGRTIRNPDCYLAPLQMTAAQSGNELTITGSAPGNWVSFYVTTPDGLPREWDPAFTANYDVTMSMTVELPSSLDGSSTLRVKSVNLAVRNAYLDSHNLTGDVVEALAKAFGGSQYFHPADYALGNVGDQVAGVVNSALSQLDGALQNAPASGFSQLALSLDPGTMALTVTIS